MKLVRLSGRVDALRQGFMQDVGYHRITRPPPCPRCAFPPAFGVQVLGLGVPSISYTLDGKALICCIVGHMGASLSGFVSEG